MEIRAAKPIARIVKLSDGGGLQLWLMPDGAKRWRLAYRFGGGQKLLAIGVYPAIGLREAREEAKRLLDGGHDPCLAKKLRQGRQGAVAANTFDAVADELLDRKRPAAKALRTIAKLEWLSSLAGRRSAHARSRKLPRRSHGRLRLVEARGRLETPAIARHHWGRVSLRGRQRPRPRRSDGRAQGRHRRAHRQSSRGDH